MNLLILITSISISVSMECLKVILHLENREKSILECQGLSSNWQDEKPMTEQGIGSIQLLS